MQNTSVIQKINNPNRYTTKDYIKTINDNETTKEKEECCLISCFKCIYHDIIESKSKEYQPLGFTISSLVCTFINVILLLISIIYSSVDFDVKKPYFYELMSNWNSVPINEMYIYNTNSHWYTLNAWQGTYIYQTLYSYNETFFDYNYTMLTFNETNGKKCGKDSFGNYLYFPTDADCPINEIFIDNEEHVNKNNQYYYRTLPLKNNKYLHYTKNNTEGNLIVQTIIRGEKKYCTNKMIDDPCYYLDNCYTDEKFFNEEECYQSDLYYPIDKMNFKDFRIDNKLEESKYYNDNDEVSLNVRTWIGLDPKLKDKLNFTDKYYEKMDITFSNEIILTVISLVKDAFFFLNERYLCLKLPFYFLEFINIFISIIIFVYEHKINSREVSKFRAYYFLYCYIYENLNKNYPKFSKTKKYFIKYYYLMLACGYIMKFISIAFKFIFYTIVLIYQTLCVCGCDCEECNVKNCLHCNKGKCKTYNNNEICSCECEECKNRKCYFCKGNKCKCLGFCCKCCFCYCIYCNINYKMRCLEIFLGYIANTILFIFIIGLFLMIISPDAASDITDLSLDFENIDFDKEK